VSNDEKRRHGRVRLVPCSHCIKDVVEIQDESERDSFCLSADWNCWSSSLDQYLPDDSLDEGLSSPVGCGAELLGNPDDEL
jgi:hypothetical protein